MTSWIDKAKITQGPVFRGVIKSVDKSNKSKKLKPRHVDRILKKYLVVIDGKPDKVGSAELRRTYARRLYEDGADLATIQRYLGCADIKAILGYIGPLAARRAEPAHPWLL